MKKFSALFVLLAFLFSLQISLQPLQAADGQKRVVTQGSHPSIVEQESDDASVSRKKSPLPIILGVVAAGALVAVLVLVVFKTKYDIVGTWTVTIAEPGNTTETHQFVFSGDKKSGTVLADNSIPGTYTVDGKDVVVSVNSGYWIGTGKFTSKDKIEGTWTNLSYKSGSWTATRVSSGAAVNAPQANGGNSGGILGK